MESITQSCRCPKKCTDKINFDTAFSMRRKFWTKQRKERSEVIMSYLMYGQKTGKWTYLFLENGCGICIQAFQLLFGVNKNSMTKHKKLVEHGAMSPFYKLRQGDSRIAVSIDWLENYASVYGDKMPNSKDILLPYRTLKKTVYYAYKTEVPNPVSESAFYSVWSRHFPHLKIKKTNTFSQCTKCWFLLNKIDNTASLEEKRSLRLERDHHIQRQMLERKYYYGKKMQSRQQPEEFLSLIIDGMDQSKTDLPHFTGRRAKVINPSALMGTHITGVLSHGHDLFLNYVDLLEYPHDPNLTINVLLKTLHHILDTKGHLPPVFYLQADNSPRDNKNKYVMAFLELLVRQKVFREVHFSFLYVGHTHEDIDAAFSKISRKLKKNSAETLPDLLELVPNAKRIENVLDVKSWMEPHLCKLKHISAPLHFKFVSAGHSVKVYYKGQQHTLWKSMTGKGTFLRAVPSGKPKLLQPDYGKFLQNLEKLKKQIFDIRHMFSSEQKYIWWTDFLNIVMVPKQKPRITEWITDLPKQNLIRRPREMEINLDQELKKMLDKESAEPEVVCEKASGKASRQKKTKLQKTRRGGSTQAMHKRQPRKNPSGQMPKRKNGHERKQAQKHGKSRKFLKKLHTSSLVIIPVDEDEKRHIWMIIFFDLLEELLSLAELFHFIFHLLLMLADIMEIMMHAAVLWNVLLQQHIGTQLAVVIPYQNSHIVEMVHKIQVGSCR